MSKTQVANLSVSVRAHVKNYSHTRKNMDIGKPKIMSKVVIIDPDTTRSEIASVEDEEPKVLK